MQHAHARANTTTKSKIKSKVKSNNKEKRSTKNKRIRKAEIDAGNPARQKEKNNSNRNQKIPIKHKAAIKLLQQKQKRPAEGAPTKALRTASRSPSYGQPADLNGLPRAKHVSSAWHTWAPPIPENKPNSQTKAAAHHTQIRALGPSDLPTKLSGGTNLVH